MQIVVFLEYKGLVMSPRGGYFIALRDKNIKIIKKRHIVAIYGYVVRVDIGSNSKGAQ